MSQLMVKQFFATTLAVSALATSGLQTFDSSYSSSSNNSTSQFSSSVVTAQAQVAQAQSSSSVAIQNFAYASAAITVTKGTTVTWTNKDSVAHTVTVDSGNGPKSGQLQKDQSYSFKFDQVGTFSYHCIPHPQMKAKVTVIEAAAPAQKPPAPAPTGQPAPSPSVGGRGGEAPPVAAGPVAAGAGSTADLQHGGLLAGATALIALAGTILFARRRLSLEK